MPHKGIGMYITGISQVTMTSRVNTPWLNINQMAKTLSQTRSTLTDADLLKLGIPSWPSRLQMYSKAVMQ